MSKILSYLFLLILIPIILYFIIAGVVAGSFNDVSIGVLVFYILAILHIVISLAKPILMPTSIILILMIVFGGHDFITEMIITAMGIVW